MARSTRSRTAPDYTIADDMLLFENDLEADGKSPKTVQTYRASMKSLQRHAAAERVTRTRELAPTFVRSWIGGMRRSGRSQGTVFNHYNGVRAFCKWAVREGHGGSDPTDEIPRPKVTAQPIPIIEDDQLRALFRTCQGRSFDVCETRRSSGSWSTPGSGERELAETAAERGRDRQHHRRRRPPWSSRQGPRQRWAANASRCSAPRPPRHCAATSSSANTMHTHQTRTYGSVVVDR